MSALLTAVTLLAGCAGSDTRTTATDDGCSPCSEYRGHRGTTVKIYSPIRGVEADALIKAWEPFEVCTGISIAYEAVGNFGVPIDVQVKSLVWHSPKYFAAEGYTVPRTWAEMLALSDRIAADGTRPWCAGVEEGFATGWPITDWLEDTLLRTAGPDVYDQWGAHRIPFDDPRVVAALDRVGGILKNPKYVNGGYGGVASIATTASKEGGLPILQHTCAMHRQASFYSQSWPPTAKVAEDGDVFAFYLPPVGAAGNPVLGGGTFVNVVTDRPEVQAVLAYLVTPEFADSRTAAGNVVSANKEFDESRLTAPLARLCAALHVRPALDAAVRTGTISGEQAAAIAELPADLDRETIGKAETVLMDQAGDFDPVTLAKLGGRILERIAPEIAEQTRS